MYNRKDSKNRALRRGEIQRKDGKYMFRITIHGKRHTIYANSLLELREKEDEITVKLCRGMDIVSPRITVNDIADIYLANKEKTVQKSTFYTMNSTYNIYVRNNMGRVKLVDLKRSMIKQFYLDLISSDTPISISTLSRIDCILTPILETAVYDDILLKNPARGVIGEIKRECGYKHHVKCVCGCYTGRDQ